MYKSFLIKYAEIGVKGKNRYIFEDRLCEQIRYALQRCEGEFEVTKTQGRIYVNALTEYDFDETVENLRSRFNISSRMARKQIEYLINKEYFKRSDSDRGIVSFFTTV